MTYIRAQKFNVDDIVEVDSGGKGVWHRAKVTEVSVGWCQVKFECDRIRWVTDKAVKGTGTHK